MMRASDIWDEHQRRRFMRPDAARFVKPTVMARRWPAFGGKALHRSVKTAPPVEDVAAERDALLRIKTLVAELKFLLAMRRFSRKCREDQARDEQGR